MMNDDCSLLEKGIRAAQEICKQAMKVGRASIHAGKRLSGVPDNAIVFFPLRPNTLCCGLAGIVSYKSKSKSRNRVAKKQIAEMASDITGSGYEKCCQTGDSIFDRYLGGKRIEEYLALVRELKQEDLFTTVYFDPELQQQLSSAAAVLQRTVEVEADALAGNMGKIETADVDVMSARLEVLKDICWCLQMELMENVRRIEALLSGWDEPISPSVVGIFKKLNAVLNSIDRLEVRGRDSAGISLLFVISKGDYSSLRTRIKEKGLEDRLQHRSEHTVLVNQGVRVQEIQDEQGNELAAVTLTYKVAAEIGHLGDNVQFLRKNLTDDRLLQLLADLDIVYQTVTAHTRWASVGSITEANCHPVDNRTGDKDGSGTINVCLNGDIDNYLELKASWEKQNNPIPPEITTDTKIIPLQIQKYFQEGNSLAEAFRLAVNDFEGSHAISMHSDLAPGKLFLAQKGSGQAVFIGLAEGYYLPASEVYGFVEDTPLFLKMDGEKIIEGRNGTTQGQIFILDQESADRIGGITACYYDGTPIQLTREDVKRTEITSRDIDRQDYPHYFLKEISESPVSVEKTIQNRWKVSSDNADQLVISLDEKVVPERVKRALAENRIRRIFFVGQGTAGVAAQACADILNTYMNDRSLQISALKASELSGFKLSEQDDRRSMSDTLMIAISQSGTTTDTNRTVDMVRERGGMTLAIVNRRDSDITFKVDGVIYTSSGRDIEMSVASTKAFYSQIVAGAILGLYLAFAKGQRGPDFITSEIKQLLALPQQMKKILSLKPSIEASAKRLAATRTYWAAVGSGPNKASADEIRIKLSELCYKTISTDYVEDKKHIDLSSEPLIIVCAAGTRGAVIGDIIKDTAIFQAHKALPVVIADEGEDRFAPYAADVFHVPVVAEHFAPIVNTLVGHIWGYYAALAINDGSSFLHSAREDIRRSIDDYAAEGLDVYEVILERGFREKIASFYYDFQKRKAEKRLPSIMGIHAASDLTLLLKYLAGRLPVADFDLDFGRKGTALNILNTFFECLGEAINTMARPIDAIKHQAKTVTVGTSRISEKVEGILFNALESYGIGISQLANRNVLVLKNLQRVVEEIRGAILYRIDGLDLLGELTEGSTIHVVRKEGVLAPIPSRVETDVQLKGTKRIIVRQGNVYIGKGRKDDRSIIIIPSISASDSSTNRLEHLLLLNIVFKERIPLADKVKALGGKYEHIKNIVQENSIAWEDQFLEMLDTDELFGRSAEKVGEFIVFNANIQAEP